MHEPRARITLPNTSSISIRSTGSCSTVHSCCKTHPISDIAAKQFIDFPMSSRFVLSLNVRLKHTVLPYNYLYMYACLCARALHDAVNASTPVERNFLQLVWVQKLGWGRRFRGWYCCRKFSQNIVMVGGTSTVR